MTETMTDIYFQMKTNDMNIINSFMKKMIMALTVDELELIEQAKVTQTMVELEVSYDAFEKDRQE